MKSNLLIGGVILVGGSAAAYMIFGRRFGGTLTADDSGLSEALAPPTGGPLSFFGGGSGTPLNLLEKPRQSDIIAPQTVEPVEPRNPNYNSGRSPYAVTSQTPTGRQVLTNTSRRRASQPASTVRPTTRNTGSTGAVPVAQPRITGLKFARRTKDNPNGEPRNGHLGAFF